jgi:hypothetical protein
MFISGNEEGIPGVQKENILSYTKDSIKWA